MSIGAHHGLRGAACPSPLPDARRASGCAAMLRPATWAVLAAGLCAGAALAQPSALPDEARLRYLLERADCDEGPAQRDRAACLRDAAAAYAEARQGALDAGQDFEVNATRRCRVLGGDDRDDCLARMQGQGVTTGSVEGGGIYREFTTREIGPAQPRP